MLYVPLIIAFVALYVALVFPVYLIGRRRGLKNPWAAFIPFLGVWIVLFESMGRSGWCSLIAFVPNLGAFVLWVWAAVGVPSHHGRSRWWTLALMVPGVNLVGYWWYALTLPRHPAEFAAA